MALVHYEHVGLGLPQAAHTVVCCLGCEVKQQEVVFVEVLQLPEFATDLMELGEVVLEKLSYLQTVVSNLLDVFWVLLTVVLEVRTL